MRSKLLEHITIVDFTTRLPGPLCSMILEDFGASVIKIENKNSVGDPFNDPELYKVNPCFKDWYQNLNKTKNIKSFDFQQDQSELIDLCKTADALIIPDHSRFLDFANKLNTKVVIKLSGGKGEWKSLHDLNALGMSQTFKLHLEDSSHPPYLPFAGISYGQYLATSILAGLTHFYKSNEAVSEVICLKDVTEKIFNTFFSESFKEMPRQLHNGAFVAYSLYNTKDHKTLCLAAIEEKYWKNLLDCFQIQLKVEDRFSTSTESFEILENTFANLDSSVIKEKIKNLDLCLTLLD